MLDSSKFPDGAPLTLSYDRGEFRGRWRGEGDGDGDALGGITAVWQNALVGTALPAMTPGVRETCVAASELALVGLLDNLDVFQLDPRARQLRAESKPRQLRIAQALGLDIPDTIISNDPAAVRAFARGRRGIVAKMLVQPASTGPEPADEVSAVFTTAMTADDLDQLDGLDLCPMIFQEQVDNRLDVRVTIVGKRMFAAAIDDDARGGSDLDWRRDSYTHDRAPVWAAHELPRTVADRLGALVDRFELQYGAIDLILRPDGQYVFLELNPRGSFTFLGREHQASIAAAIADVLVDPGARREPRSAS